MLRHLPWISLGLTLALILPGAAADAQYGFGGDLYFSGQNPTISQPVLNDAFVAGNTVLLKAGVAGDAHMAGFNVTADAPITGNLYGAGYAVTASAPIGGDVTAIGNTIALTSGSSVAGNARLAAATITLSAPVAGSALVSAQTLTLEAPIAGDLSFFGETITFAPGAKVEGQISIKALKPVDVPVWVAPADRVTYERADVPNYVNEAGKTANGALSGLWPAVWGLASWLLLLFAAGAAVITFMPKAVAAAQAHAAAYPLRTFGRGILAFSMTLGIVIVAGLTVIGLFAIPILIVAIGLVCSFAYIAGCYLVAIRVFVPFLTIETNPRRLGVLVAALALATLVGLIPFVGWLITLALVCFGFGAMAASRRPQVGATPANTSSTVAPA